MTTWADKVERAAGDELEDGERVLAAVFVAPTATSLTASALAARGQGDALAASLPATTAVLGLTDRRLLVFDHSSLAGRPDRLRLAMPVGELRRVDIDERSATCRFVLRFVDGSRAEYEAPSGVNDPAAFVAAARDADRSPAGVR